MELSESAVDVIKMGVTCAVFALLFIAMVPLALTTRHWYMAVENRQSQTGYLNSLSDTYTMEQKGEVTGNDIVEFILKNDSRYDYYITVNGSTYPVTRKKAESFLKAGKETSIWSEDYLMDTVFLNNSIFDSYKVVTVWMNDETVSYKFYQI